MPQKILAVDDDPVELRRARFVLETFGFDVATASSSDEAFLALRGSSVDLVLGHERVLEADAAGRIEAPVLLLTEELRASADAGDGDADRIMRSADPMEILERIELTFARRNEVCSQEDRA